MSKKTNDDDRLIPEDFNWDGYLNNLDDLTVPGSKMRYRVYQDEAYDTEHIEALAESINARGLEVPVVVWVDPKEPEVYHVIDGRARVIAMSVAGIKMPYEGLKEIPPPSESEEISWRLILNAARRSMSTGEKKALLVDLWEKTDWSYRELEQQTGIPYQTVGRLIKEHKDELKGTNSNDDDNDTRGLGGKVTLPEDLWQAIESKRSKRGIKKTDMYAEAFEWWETIQSLPDDLREKVETAKNRKALLEAALTMYFGASRS